MNPKIIEYPKPIPRHDKIPNCEYRPLQFVRIYRKKFPDGYHLDILEMLYEDGGGKLFWGPVPVVEEYYE